MRVGYYQFHPEFGAPTQNLEKVQDALKGANADIIVLPELAFTGYYFEDRAELSQLAEDVSESAILKGLTTLCQANQYHIVTGFAERNEDRLYNSALVVGPTGLLHQYRKLHLFNTEKEYFDPGDTPLSTIEISGATVGVMICFDWVFPEVARSLALLGADILCHPSNLVLTYCQQTMRTRSLENSVYTITANRTGQEKRPRGELAFTGQSQIVGPKGDVIKRSGADEEGVVICEIDLSAARNKRMTENNDLFLDRRPEFYDAIAAPNSSSTIQTPIVNEPSSSVLQFSDIKMAFEFVSSAPMSVNTAILCKDTGEIFYTSDYDDMDEIPEEAYLSDDCIQIPHKNDMDMGKNLVFEFVERYLPNDFGRVRQIFRSSGAYARYKDLLDDRGQLKQWIEYENARQTETLREWCHQNRIKLSD